uniref:Uncharacterized protein n=1 Tax=Oryza punctata TaxID=4537 RepID=A0A0E0L2C8_ORYPU
MGPWRVADTTVVLHHVTTDHHRRFRRNATVHHAEAERAVLGGHHRVRPEHHPRRGLALEHQLDRRHGRAHALNGATAGTRAIMDVSAANASVTALWMEVSSTGVTVLNLVPPTPFLLMASSVVFSGTARPFTLMPVKPTKYSVDLSPLVDTPAVLTGLTRSGV